MQQFSVLQHKTTLHFFLEILLGSFTELAVGKCNDQVVAIQADASALVAD